MARKKKKTPPPSAITIFVKPYVRKYVIRKLSDPERMYWDATARKLWTELEAELDGRQLCAVRNTLDPAVDRLDQRLVLEVQPKPGRPADISYYQHRYVTAVLHKAYIEDMCTTVHWYRTYLRQGVRRSMEHFRRLYGVNEDDHALTAAERVYYARTRRAAGNRS